MEKNADWGKGKSEKTSTGAKRKNVDFKIPD